MQIVCPHCTTSYAVNPASFGPEGRTVRCSRCKETWLAYPENNVRAGARIPAMAHAEAHGAQWDAIASGTGQDETAAPSVESPSIAGDWPDDDQNQMQSGDAWPSLARQDGVADHNWAVNPAVRWPWLRRLPKLPTSLTGLRLPARIPVRPSISLPTACAAMGALALALLIWRVDVVRLLPQTAAFYKLVGLDVNLRGLSFKDVKLSSETVDGKPVLVIEGVIVDEGRKAAMLPRLRFSVRDEKGTEIYAWNAVLEQPAIEPGEKAWFRSRLASPPPEGRSIDIRFFNRRDIAAGSGA